MISLSTSSFIMPSSQSRGTGSMEGFTDVSFWNHVGVEAEVEEDATVRGVSSVGAPVC